MYLTDITSTISDAIDASSPENWPGGVVLPTDSYPVYDALDPSSTIIGQEKGIYLIPAYNEYDLSSVRRPGSRGAANSPAGLTKTKRIIVGVCCPLESRGEVNESHDVSLKSEWILASKLVEDLESFLLNLGISGLKLIDIETQPPDEEMLDKRVFFTQTILGYRTCNA